MNSKEFLCLRADFGSWSCFFCRDEGVVRFKTENSKRKRKLVQRFQHPLCNVTRGEKEKLESWQRGRQMKNAMLELMLYVNVMKHFLSFFFHQSRKYLLKFCFYRLVERIPGIVITKMWALKRGLRSYLSIPRQTLKFSQTLSNLFRSEV